MMNDGMLSQDEIDALLNGSNDTEDFEEDSANVEASKDEYLSSIEEDALGEIGNISFGSSATTLSTILNQKVEITTPTISVVQKGELKEEFPAPYVGVEVKYTEGFTGANLFILEAKDAAIIADLMLGGAGAPETNELTDIHLSAVQEAMNQMMGTAATSMSTVFNKRVDISPPITSVMDVTAEETKSLTAEDDVLVKVSFHLKIGTLIDSKIMQLLPITFAKDLVDQLLNSSDDTSEASNSTTVIEDSSPGPIDHTSVSDNHQKSQQSSQQSSDSNPSSTAEPHQPRQLGSYVGGSNAEVQAASFSNFEEVSLQENERRNLDLLMDIPLQVTVELGRTKRTVKEILELSSGSIIELDKLAGEPVDILVNQRLIAKGEVVVIDENFGVRVTDIVSKEDRLKQLK
ncbi:flagellar motor switch protein FliN [Gracilibacillus boraciitolerans JCM 21714]|uniref:Flagellar motor switch protein FliN n=1 Tax=Gracilibacillus boraciitolerans JCM 21714 TaxID=1298598 RepID=W4VFS7_9BACI|nr:flagellar motor switch phosphatase FliY [Gracilibacillus boraciitolerans]GAE91619.1 flagellar motor switch protein FliN [Gracilibacillus boraciitolerans JCM 21714]